MEINMFSDKVRIFIKSGKGGDGHVSSDVSFMCLPVVRMVVMAVTVVT